MTPEGDVSVVARLRRLVLAGHYPPGSRVTEDGVAEALGVSRTPVRLALRTLTQEGLLEPLGRRGLAVRRFSAEDVSCAVEVRGALEGLAARRLAERGLTAELLAILREAVDAGRVLLAKGPLVPQDMAHWSALNRRFHGAIVQGAGSPVIGDAIARNNHLPFASADSITLDTTDLSREHERLRIAQWQHELVLDALERGEATRVEQLMREHALVGLRYAELLPPGDTRRGSSPAPGSR